MLQTWPDAHDKNLAAGVIRTTGASAVTAADAMAAEPVLGQQKMKGTKVAPSIVSTGKTT